MTRSDETTTIASGYDAELHRLDPAFLQACDVQLRDRVLDIGCGAGGTTRAAGERARDGDALGVDVSAAAVERARALALAHGPGNVAFECADAQVHRFAEQGFDLAISRFGTMFFDDAGAAFTNIARALRPAGRLVLMVWQAGDRNEWVMAVRRAVTGSAQPDVDAEAFSLADPSRTTAVLEGAGFVDIAFTEVDEPVWYGPDEAAALAWVRGFTWTGEHLERLGRADAERALGRLRETVRAHLHDDGVWFGSRAWIVTARRADPLGASPTPPDVARSR